VSARILLVEDEPGIQLAMKGLLRREGYELQVAGSGTEALDRLGTGSFDLLLTDLSLPDGVSGLDLARHVQRESLALPVVLITAYGSERIAQEASDAGVFDYVPKPFNNDQVREVVRRALGIEG
jgi:DNA-binding NtrC family response regulator